MVARFHEAGLEIILDVVYNHTAEGNERGPTLSFKGIDNASYYRLLPDEKRYYINDTGTGNTVNISHPRVIQMVTDSLRYWVAGDACRRLPLRSRHDPRARAERLRQSERLSESLRPGSCAARVKLIAEPWVSSNTTESPAGRAIAASSIPGFGDQLHGAAARILAAGFEKAALVVEAVGSRARIVPRSKRKPSTCISCTQ